MCLLGSGITAMQFDIEFKTIENERRRVAKELHDEILPLFARLTRCVQARAAEPSGQEIVDELHKTVGNIRDLLGELHPVDLEELGLVPALKNICARYARLTKLCVLFVERAEEYLLSDLQQLCIYRAMQAVLKMFSESGNDILVVICDCVDGLNQITVRCVDKHVSSAEWLSVEQREFNLFEACCNMAHAPVQIGVTQSGSFPIDLIIALPNLETQTQEAWVCALAHTDPNEPKHALFENLAVESERKRIKGEINRLIMPQFASLTALADELGNKILYREIRQYLEVISASLECIISELHPPVLAQNGLESSMRTLVERFFQDSRIRTSVHFEIADEQLQLSQESMFAVYRSTQEALNNIENHSGATRAKISVRRHADCLLVCIDDNGKGIQVRAGIQSRGLKNIRERIQAIGAEVSFERSLYFSSGTCVSIKLPCVVQSGMATSSSATLASNPSALRQ